MSEHGDLDPAELRARAEALLEGRTETRPPDLGDAELAHELNVYQVELELQNQELRETNERLQVLNERYFSLFDSAPVAYLMLDPQGRIRDANVAAANLLQKGRAELTGLPLLRVVAADDLTRLHHHLTNVFEAQSAHETMLTLREPVDAMVLVHSVWTDGSCLSILTDVTQLRRAEAQLELARRQAEVNDLAKSQFVAVMSHEIRNPLTQVVAHADLLLELFPDHPGSEGLIRILGAADAITALVDNLANVSSVEQVHIELRQDALVPSDVTGAVVASCTPRCKEKGLQLEVEVLDSAHTALAGDEDRYRQCVLNLLDNAIRYTPAGGRIRLNVAWRAGTLVTIVDDSGPGVPEHDRDEIFRPYSQSGLTDAATTQGVGAGLAVTSRLVELMGGKILVGDSPLGGARFVLQIPLDAVADLLGAIGQPQAGDSVRKVGEGPLLVVDDDPNMREVEGMMLDELGLDYVIATSGTEALEWLAKGSHRAVLLDIEMPGMDGLEVVRRIRAHPDLKHLPVAALSARAMPDDVDDCIKAGCDLHIGKPFRLAELRERIETLLAISQSSGS